MEDGALEKLANNSMPCVGMKFDSEEGAYEFYNEYGRIVGFSIRRDYHAKSKKDGIMINRKFVCCKEGEKEKDKWYITVKHPQHETRTKCNAFMYISFRRDLSKWVLMKFDDNHNHLLHFLNASHDLISALAGGKEFVGFTREDQKTYLRAKRQRNLQYGEAGSRWRLDAKDCAIEETVTVVENDPKLVIAARYKDLCPRMVKLAARSSEYKPAYQLVDETLKDLCAKVDNMMTSLDNSGASSSDGNIEVGTKEFVVDPNFARAKGLKRKEGRHKGGSRLKPWHEKTTKRTKVVSQPTRLTQDVDVPYWPQLMNFGYNLLMHDANFACPPTNPQSTPLSSLASYNPQSSQGLGFDLAEHSPMVAESVFRNDKHQIVHIGHGFKLSILTSNLLNSFPLDLYCHGMQCSDKSLEFKSYGLLCGMKFFYWCYETALSENLASLIVVFVFRL
ncbi:hypothetical protein ACSBR2_031342 [Camellia fascicularis]